MDRTWQDNADEFAALDKGEGWAFAVLVACSVEKGTAGRPVIGARAPISQSKTSARDFADRAKTSHDRVLRYLRAWDKAANDYRPDMLPSVELKPGDVLTAWHPDIPWKEADGGYYEPVSGGRPRDGKPEDAAKIIEKRGAAEVIAALPASTTREVLREAEARVYPAGRPSVNPFAARSEQADERTREWNQMEQRTSEAPAPKTPLDWSRAQSLLTEAVKKIKEAVPFIADHSYEGEEHDLLSEILTEITDTVDMARAALDPSADWDAEAADLMGGTE